MLRAETQARYAPMARSALLAAALIFWGYPLLNNPLAAPSHPGVGFTALCLLALIIIGTTAVLHAGRMRPLPVEVIFFLYLFVFGLHVAYNFNVPYREETVAAHINAIVQSLSLYALARFVPIAGKSAIRVFQVSLLLLAAFCSMVWRLSVDDPLTQQMSYQTVAAVALIAAIFASTFSKGAVRFVTVIGSASLLIVVQARSEVVGYAVYLLMLYIDQIRSCAKRYLPLLLLVVAFLPLALFLGMDHFEIVGSAFDGSRVLRLFDLANDSSFQHRMLALSAALETIEAHPLLGDYGEYVPGTYAHNILSIWVDLGLAGVILFVLLFFFAGRTIGAVSRRPADPRISFILKALFVILVVLFLTAKAFFYPVTGLLVGLVANAASGSRGRRSLPAHVHRDSVQLSGRFS